MIVQLLPFQGRPLLRKGFLQDCRRSASAYQDRWHRCVVRATPRSRGRLLIVDDTRQPVGAFKLRGATVAVEELVGGSRSTVTTVVAASSGSFGMSVAHAARAAGLRATVFMPSSVRSEKRADIEKLGATVQATATSYEGAKRAAQDFAAESGARRFLDGVSWEVFKGNASLVLELMEVGWLERRRSAMVVPLGIGSLAVPIALALLEAEYDCDLFVVEPLAYCKFLARHHAGVKAAGGRTVADGAAVSEVPAFSLSWLDSHARGVIALDEAEIGLAMQLLWNSYGIRAEGAGALAFGALLSSPAIFDVYDDVFVFVTGAGVSDTEFRTVLAGLDRHRRVAAATEHAL